MRLQPEPDSDNTDDLDRRHGESPRTSHAVVVDNATGGDLDGVLKTLNGHPVTSSAPTFTRRLSSSRPALQGSASMVAAAARLHGRHWKKRRRVQPCCREVADRSNTPRCRTPPITRYCGSRDGHSMFGSPKRSKVNFPAIAENEPELIGASLHRGQTDREGDRPVGQSPAALRATRSR